MNIVKPPCTEKFLTFPPVENVFNAVMANDVAEVGYKIWGVDDVVYGPVELPVLISWAQEERVTRDTWVFSLAENRWRKACELSELKILFKRKAALGTPESDSHGPIKTGVMRRVKIFAEMSEEQLTALTNFVVPQNVRQWAVIVKQGDPGDAMFLLLEGEVRVRLMISGKETTLTTLGAGEFFGEISLFDDGPRSADIVANKECLVYKITVENFNKLANEHPDLATPMLLAIGKTLTARIRADNKRYRDQINFARAAGAPA